MKEFTRIPSSHHIQNFLTLHSIYSVPKDLRAQRIKIYSPTAQRLKNSYNSITPVMVPISDMRKKTFSNGTYVSEMARQIIAAESIPLDLETVLRNFESIVQTFDSPIIIFGNKFNYYDNGVPFSNYFVIRYSQYKRTLRTIKSNEKAEGYRTLLFKT